jgi:hypothetical protein
MPFGRLLPSTGLGQTGIGTHVFDSAGGAIIALMEASAPTALVVATREDMILQAKRVIDAARERGVTLRLVGGLAVRFHCKSLEFCERDHGDIDLVGHRRDANRIASLFSTLGFGENMHVRLATEGRQLQFARECRHDGEWARCSGPSDDHIDVFLDTFKMEHALDLAGRLDLDGYTITVSDVLLTKLQMTALTEKDERDILTLLRDLELGAADAPGTIDVPYVARVCARDWGLFHDVEANLALLRRHLDAYALEPAVSQSVQSKLARLEAALEAEPKSRTWRLRAKIGTRRPWHDTVEEQE